MMGVQLQQNEDVVWKPADEESGDEGRHDLEGFGRFGHLIVFEFEDDDRVAEDDDQEGNHEPCKEAAPRHVLVAVSICGVIVDASHLPLVVGHVTEHHTGHAECNRHHPGQDHHGWGLPDGALILRPHGKRHRHTAVCADDHQQEDAAEHVEEHDEGGELAHDQAEYPLSQRQVCDAQGQAGTEDEVRDGQA